MRRVSLVHALLALLPSNIDEVGAGMTPNTPTYRSWKVIVFSLSESC
jgi:hypothetical protein